MNKNNKKCPMNMKGGNIADDVIAMANGGELMGAESAIKKAGLNINDPRIRAFISSMTEGTGLNRVGSESMSDDIRALGTGLQERQRDI